MGSAALSEVWAMRLGAGLAFPLSLPHYNIVLDLTGLINSVNTRLKIMLFPCRFLFPEFLQLPHSVDPILSIM